MGRDDAEGGCACKTPEFKKKRTDEKAGQGGTATLHRRGDGDAVRQIIEQRVSKAPKCPRCGAAHIRCYGMEHGLQRYRLCWLRPHFHTPGLAMGCSPGCARRNAGHPWLTRSSNRIRCAKRRARFGSPRAPRSAGATVFCACGWNRDREAYRHRRVSTRVLFGKAAKASAGWQERRANAAARLKSLGFRTNRPRC